MISCSYLIQDGAQQFYQSRSRCEYVVVLNAGTLKLMEVKLMEVLLTFSPDKERQRALEELNAAVTKDTKTFFSILLIIAVLKGRERVWSTTSTKNLLY